MRILISLINLIKLMHDELYTNVDLMNQLHALLSLKWFRKIKILKYKKIMHENLMNHTELIINLLK